MSGQLPPLDIRWRPSPNHRSRNGHAIRLVVLHSDASHTLSGTIDWISRPESKVSYHYSIGRTGKLYQHVKDDRSAWHAGKSIWNGETDGRGGVNDFSLGVNLSNRQDGTERYPEAQLDAAARLVASLCSAYRIPALNITTHTRCCVPPGRKHDPYPGERTFDFAAFLMRVQLAASEMLADPEAA